MRRGEFRLSDRARVASEAFVLVIVAACLDNPVTPKPSATSQSGVVASEPLGPSLSVRQSPNNSASITAAEVTYVSFASGTYADAGIAVIRNPRLGIEVMRPVSAGGMDPVAIPGGVGDTIDIRLQGIARAEQSVAIVVPSAVRPTVIRTIPGRGKKDVPLNARIVVVFSEPMRATTATTIRLLRAGVLVSTVVSMSADGLRAELRSDELLAPNTTYTLLVPEDVTDLQGQTLAASVQVDFATGTTIASASVVTEEAALLANEFNNSIRTFEMSASRSPTGAVSGRWLIYYEAEGT